MKFNLDRALELAADRCIEDLVAACARVAANFIQLPIAGSPTPIFRERVYCYELYHQIRQLQGDPTGYVLGGEVDKRGHPILQHENIRYAKPDLVFHFPGDMGVNLVVIEIKAVSARKSAVRKDLVRLTGFRQFGRYRRSVLLIYGEDERRLRRIHRNCLAIQEDDSEDDVNLNLIDLLWHRTQGHPAIHVPWEAA